MKKKTNYSQNSEAELIAELKQEKSNLLDMKFQLISNELKDNSQIGKKRKDISRIETFLTTKRRESSE
jgi:ribosomal protein L29